MGWPNEVGSKRMPGILVARNNQEDVLRREASHHNPSKRKAAARKIGNKLEKSQNNTRLIFSLMDLARDSNADVRAAAVRAFSRLSPQKMFRLAINLADKIKDKKTAKELLQIVETNHPDSAHSRMASFLKDIFDNSSYNGKKTMRAKSGEHVVVQYNGIPYYSLVYKKDELVTIIPSLKDIKVKGNNILVSYPKGFNVHFENFPKTIDRNNWCLKWLYKMPKGFFKDLRLLNFSGRNGKDRAGDYSSSRINVYYNSNGDGTIVHELGHYWHIRLASREEKRVFNGISWRNENWRREGDVDDFRGNKYSECASGNCKRGPGINVSREDHPYGMENWFEDAADICRDYFDDPVDLRHDARRLMGQNNYELAVKYLAFRYLSPVTGAEYDLSPSSPTLTISEVKTKIEAYISRNPFKVKKTTIEALNKIIVLAKLTPGESVAPVQVMPAPVKPPESKANPVQAPAEPPIKERIKIKLDEEPTPKVDLKPVEESKLEDYGSTRSAWSHHLGLGINFRHVDSALEGLDRVGEIPEDSGGIKLTAGANIDIGIIDLFALTLNPYLDFSGKVGFQQLNDQEVYAHSLNTGLNILVQRLSGFDKVFKAANAFRFNIAYSRHNSDVANYPNPDNDLLKVGAGMDLLGIGPVSFDSSIEIETGERAGSDFSRTKNTNGFRFSHSIFDSFVGYRLERFERELIDEKTLQPVGETEENVSHGLVARALLDLNAATISADGYVDLDRTNGPRRWGVDFSVRSPWDKKGFDKYDPERFDEIDFFRRSGGHVNDGEWKYDSDSLNALVENFSNEIKEVAKAVSLTVSPPSYLEDIKKILEVPDLYEKMLKAEIKVETDIQIDELLDKTKFYRSRRFSDLSLVQQNKIIALNRLLIEAVAPNNTPTTSDAPILLMNIFGDVGVSFEREETIFGAGTKDTLRVHFGPSPIPLIYNRSSHHDLYLQPQGFVGFKQVKYGQDDNVALPANFPYPEEQREVFGGVNLTFSYQYKQPRSLSDDHSDEVNTFRTRSRMNYSMVGGLREMHDLVPGEKIVIERAKVVERDGLPLKELSESRAQKLASDLFELYQITRLLQLDCNKQLVAVEAKIVELLGEESNALKIYQSLPKDKNIGWRLGETFEKIWGAVPASLKPQIGSFDVTDKDFKNKSRTVLHTALGKLKDNKGNLFYAEFYAVLDKNITIKVDIPLESLPALVPNGANNASNVKAGIKKMIPNSVTGLKVVKVGSDLVTVVWDAPKGGAEKYAVYLFDFGTANTLRMVADTMLDDSFSEQKGLPEILSSALFSGYPRESVNNNIPLGGLKPDTSYMVAVVSLKNGKTSIPETISFRTSSLVEPATNLRVVKNGSSTVVVGWDIPKGGVDNFKVALTEPIVGMNRSHVGDKRPSCKSNIFNHYMKRFEKFGYPKTTKNNEYKLTGLEPNTSYTLTIISEKDGYERSCSKLLNIATKKRKLPPPPPKPKPKPKPKPITKKTAKNPSDCNKAKGQWIPLPIPGRCK